MYNESYVRMEHCVECHENFNIGQKRILVFEDIKNRACGNVFSEIQSNDTCRSPKLNFKSERQLLAVTL